MNEEALLEMYPALHEDGGGQKYRVVRGGSWHGVGPAGLWASPRSYVSPEYRLGDSGFRCVLGPSSVQPTPKPAQ
jgi:formylglycine-generating enzyme required for sulfatase activity